MDPNTAREGAANLPNRIPNTSLEDTTGSIGYDIMQYAFVL